jgi:carbamoyl-phosphate synthase large subunit
LKKYNILVTGCGGDIGQSIGKILLECNLFENVFGADINDQHAAQFIYEKLFLLPLCNNPIYIEVLKNVIEQNQIDFLLPISEPEIRFFTLNKFNDNFFSSKLICANLKSREIGFDKLSTTIFLENSGLPFPKTEVINKMVKYHSPLILKSRNGSGSKSIFLINNVKDFDFYKQKYPNFIAQELLVDSPDEYTCGLFRSKSGEIRHIIYKRKLVDSYSGYGEVVENESISELLVTIANNLDLVGSINVQLKLSKKGPCVFEINPRFSSTVRFRHLMGFEDIIWSIHDVLNLPIKKYQPPKTGTKFYKGFNEYIS